MPELKHVANPSEPIQTTAGVHLQQSARQASLLQDGRIKPQNVDFTSTAPNFLTGYTGLLSES